MSPQSQVMAPIPNPRLRTPAPRGRPSAVASKPRCNWRERSPSVSLPLKHVPIATTRDTVRPVRGAVIVANCERCGYQGSRTSVKLQLPGIRCPRCAEFVLRCRFKVRLSGVKNRALGSEVRSVDVHCADLLVSDCICCTSSLKRDRIRKMYCVRGCIHGCA
jgi:predicted Zn-ribbon and HTH transcriptional regulator